MKFTRAILLMGILISSQAKGQGTSQTVEPKLSYIVKKFPSRFYQEGRELKILLPPNYSEQKKYPVAYVTDGGSGLYDMACTYLSLSARQNTIPETIIVGIPHKQRWKELDVFWSADGRKFKDYLFQELVPQMDSSYATSGFNLIIGHSDGAEYNQGLMLDSDNPFRGFINMSPSLNTDISKPLAQFFQDYEGGVLYYFIASGAYDLPERIAAGKLSDSLYAQVQNGRIRFTHNVYRADHENLIARTLLDGIYFIFQDYRNLDHYADIKAFSEQYVKNMVQWYGIHLKPDFYDIDYYFGDILENKDLKAYEYLTDYATSQQIFEQSTLDRANQYFYMEFYPQAITYWEKTIEDLEGISPRVFYYNFNKAIDAYLLENNPQGALAFLEKSKKHLPQYALEFHYFIAKVALENHLEPKTGQASLQYCQENFKKNRYFTQEDLQKLAE